MNLTEEEYLHLVDQMTLLRMQNERYLQDNTILLRQLQKQKIILEQREEEKDFGQYLDLQANLQGNHIIDSNFGFKNNSVLKKIVTPNPYSNQLSWLQSMTPVEQNRYLQQQIKQLRTEIYAFKNEHQIKLSQLPSQKGSKISKQENMSEKALINKEAKESSKKKSIELLPHKKSTKSNLSQRELKKGKQNDDNLIDKKHELNIKRYLSPKLKMKSTDRTYEQEGTSEIQILKPTFKGNKSRNKIVESKEQIEQKRAKNKSMKTKANSSCKDIEKKSNGQSEKVLKSSKSVGLISDKQKSNIKKVRQSLKQQAVPNTKPIKRTTISKKEYEKERKKSVIKGHR